MKMAVARPEEIEKALHLAGILDDVDDGQFPRAADGEFQDGDPTWFDEDDFDHLQTFYKRVMACGGLWRVALGYATLTAAANRIIDPDQACLELHPRLVDGLKAAETPFRYWFGRLWRHIDYVKTAWSEEAAEAVRG